jgi:sec-independent protein translocase protein TatB
MAQDAKDDLGRELGHDLSSLDLRDLDPREVVRRSILDDPPPAITPPKAPPLAQAGDLPPVDPDAT